MIPAAFLWASGIGTRNFSVWLGFLLDCFAFGKAVSYGDCRACRIAGDGRGDDMVGGTRVRSDHARRAGILRPERGRKKNVTYLWGQAVLVAVLHMGMRCCSGKLWGIIPSTCYG